MVPFEVTIKEEQRDKHLLEKLSTEHPGILRWAVEGCLQWQRQGLGEPQQITDATNLYRVEMDRLGDFLDDRCERGVEYQVKNTVLWQAYERWAKLNGDQFPLGRKQFSSRLAEKGYTKGKSDGMRYWKGLRLNQSQEYSANDEIPL